MNEKSSGVFGTSKGLAIIQNCERFIPENIKEWLRYGMALYLVLLVVKATCLLMLGHKAFCCK